MQTLKASTPMKKIVGQEVLALYNFKTLNILNLPAEPT